MESLNINGKSLKFFDRKLQEHELSNDNQFKFHRRTFVPFETDRISHKVNKKLKSNDSKRNYAEIVESKTHKRKILKRPRRFKNYYTDRKPLSISHFEFPRFGEQLLFRGRQTLCKYYKENELINDRLIQIKSAITINDFEKVINDQIREKKEVVKIIEPYYDTSSILANSIKPRVYETCLCTNDYYRLNDILEEKGKPQCKISTLISKVTSNAIKNKFTIADTSIDDFIHLASECYNNYIQRYLKNLDECNQKAEKRIKRQSTDTDQTTIENTKPPSLDKSDKINENILTAQLNKLNINLHTNCEFKPPPLIKIHLESTGQSDEKFSKCRTQAMNCSDTNNNNNNTEGTNQLGDPPKIIFSDFSTEKQTTQDKSDKDLSDSRSLIDKNCLTIPITKYCSEARPP